MIARPPLLPDNFAPRRILVCQQRQLGDVLLATPALELLHRRFPYAHIDLLTEKKCLPLLTNNPHVHRVWSLDKGAMPSLLHEVRWYWGVARTGYDVVINFQHLPRLRWVVGFSCAPVRMATTPPWYLRPLYTHVVNPPQDVYAPASKVALLAPLGIVWQGERPQLYLTAAERQQAHTLLHELGLAEGQVLVTLDPTHRQPTRRWPLHHYARMMALMVEGAQHMGLDLRFLPLWGPGEMSEVRSLLDQCTCTERVLMPPAMLDLRLMSACIEAAALHVGNCSAPRHMAVAVGTPTCVALGATSQVWTYPSPEHVALAADLPCQPCERNSCDQGLRCLEQLSPQRMAAAALDLLRGCPKIYPQGH